MGRFTCADANEAIINRIVLVIALGTQPIAGVTRLAS